MTNEPRLQGQGFATGDYYLRFGLRSRYAKFTCKQVIQMREMFANGINRKEIKVRFKLSDAALHCILHKKTYKDCK